MVCKTFEELRETVREKVRQEQGSLRAVARETGISPTHLNQFKSGKRNLRFETLDKMAGHYGVKYTLKNH
jgi:transcriptional regulator with XRE-family HTH domain